MRYGFDKRALGTGALVFALAACAVAAPPALARQRGAHRPSDPRSERILHRLHGMALASASDDGQEEDSRTLVVDKDKQQCPDADFNSIQAAVTEASAARGSLILVCPDEYDESVTVPQTLTLQAVRYAKRKHDGTDDVEFGAANPTDNCFTPALADPSRDAIVQGGVLGFGLLADDVVVDGFVIQNHTIWGVVTGSTHSGFRISDNLVQDNASVGVDMRDNGQRRNSIKGNCVRSNQRPPEYQRFGIAEGLPGGNTRIERNSAFRNRQAITFDASPDSKASENRIRDNRAGLVAFDSTEIVFAHNSVLRARGVGVFMGGVTGGRITDNGVREGGLGIIMGFENTDLRVEKNDVLENAFDGLVLSGGTTSSLVEDNKVRDNGEDGIEIDPDGNGANLLRRNVSLGNAAFDCADHTVGPGTGGTLNTWLDNIGRTDNRGGALCQRPRDDN
jgi:parallel beta helix pectate lyase-like protein